MVLKSRTRIRHLLNTLISQDPNISIGKVDLCDVSKIHVNTIEADKVLILAGSQVIPMRQIAEILKFSGHHQAPAMKAAHCMLKLMALLQQSLQAQQIHCSHIINDPINDPTLHGDAKAKIDCVTLYLREQHFLNKRQSICSI